jgi:hypothetical protein
MPVPYFEPGGQLVLQGHLPVRLREYRETRLVDVQPTCGFHMINTYLSL